MRTAMTFLCLAVLGGTIGLPRQALARQSATQVEQVRKSPIEPLPTYVEPRAIPLRAAPAGAPGEQWESFSGVRGVRNVTVPTLTPFLPDPAIATGAAVIVAPGGGFKMLSIDSEGYEVARWLADHGIAAFLLKYRLESTPRDPQAFLTSFRAFVSALTRGGASPGTADRVSAPAEPLADAEAAVRLVRARAPGWNIDPARVGFTGFSAGAFLTLAIGFDADKAARPDFIAPIYGPLNIRTIPADAPPMFAAMAMDDPILFGQTDIGLIKAYLAAKRPAELHLYERGGHGFGMKTQNMTSDLWIDQFYAWMKDRGLLARH